MRERMSMQWIKEEERGSITEIEELLLKTQHPELRMPNTLALQY